MPLFICRWQNGDFSAVSARSRAEAEELLDEVGNADAAEVFGVKNFMVHFRLKKNPGDLSDLMPVELEGFGEETYSMLCEDVYPIYEKVVTDTGVGLGEIPIDQRESALKKLTDALVTERNRNWGMKQPAQSDDPAVARLQEQFDMPKSTVEGLVNEGRREALAKVPPITKKTQ